MESARKMFTEVKIRSDPSSVFADGKKMILSNLVLKNHFKAICIRNAAELSPSSVDTAAQAVYDTIINKVCNARFAVPFRLFKENQVLSKEKLALRNTLKVTAAQTSNRNLQATCSSTKNQGSEKSTVSKSAGGKKKRPVPLNGSNPEKKKHQESTVSKSAGVLSKIKNIETISSGVKETVSNTVCEHGKINKRQKIPVKRFPEIYNRGRRL